jgi:hypothetical protein
VAEAIGEKPARLDFAAGVKRETPSG